MNPEEMAAAVAALRAENEELRERVTDLEIRVARGHNCSIDLCSLDVDGACRFAGRSS